MGDTIAMERKISLPLYLVAFVITAIVFVLGVYVGELISQTKEESLQHELTDISELLSSAQLLLLMEDSPTLCPAYTEELARLDERTDRLGYRLNYLEETQGTIDVELKKSYFVLETQAYLLSKKIKERCEQDYPIILYFYSNQECDDCYEQGAALLEVKQELPTTRIYSFDGTLGSPIANALQAQFNATTYPSLVINERLYEGLQSKEKIIESVDA